MMRPKPMVTGGSASIVAASTLAITLNLYIMEFIPKQQLVRSESLRLAFAQGDAPAQPAPDLSKAPGSAYLFALTQATGEPCGRDEDCGPAALCCEHTCAAVEDCEPASPTTGGPGGSSGGGTPTTGAATADGSTSTGPGAVPEAQFEPGDAGCACDADNRRGAPIEVAGLLVLTAALRRRRGAGPTS